MSKSDEARIAALLREREGYVRYGRDSRLADVDAELKRLGYEDKAKKPQGRASREAKQTTAD